MKSIKLLSLAAVLAIGVNAQTITLNGENITPRDIVLISNGAMVDISKDALNKVNKAHDVLLNAAKMVKKFMV